MIPVTAPDPGVQVALLALAVYVVVAGHHARLARQVALEGGPLTGLRYAAFVAGVAVAWPLVMAWVLTRRFR